MRGPLSYIGGKTRLAKQIIEMLPAHKTYVEVFSGGAQVLFHKEPSEVEVLNDLDGEIVNFFRVCQQHPDELIRYLKYMLVSRTWFELLKVTNPASLTDIQRAARHLYLLKNNYGSMVVKQNYHLHVVQPPGFNLDALPESIAETHKRLARVQIECLPYEKVLKHFDRTETLFYLDPPYFGRNLYRYNLSADDFAKMAERLASLRGKFILSLNDLPEVRKIFHRFKIQGIKLAYSAQPSSGRRYSEVLITNF
ncbi:MAG: DNA adenine methylase [Acidobacteriaceae bacterium]|jgi:DNA adenine methylase